MDAIDNFYNHLVSTKIEKKISRKFKLRVIMIRAILPVLLVCSISLFILGFYYDAFLNKTVESSEIIMIAFLLSMPMFLYIFFLDNPESIRKSSLNTKLFVYIYFTRRQINNYINKESIFKFHMIKSMFVKLWYLFSELLVNSQNLFVFSNVEFQTTILEIRNIFNYKSISSLSKDNLHLYVTLFHEVLGLYYLRNEEKKFALSYDNNNEVMALDKMVKMKKIIDEINDLLSEHNEVTRNSILNKISNIIKIKKRYIFIITFIVLIGVSVYLSLTIEMIQNAVTIILAFITVIPIFERMLRINKNTNDSKQ